MIWAILSAALALIAATIITYKLFVAPDRFNALERFGMGFIGAGLVLTLPPLFAPSHPALPEPTPFDDWSIALLRLGCCVYFAGRAWRHPIANWFARRAARAHFRSKGR